MTAKTPRFYVLPNNALGVRDTLDGNNIHLGSRIEAIEVATMLNVFHDRAVECKQMVGVQAQKILELTGDIEAGREVYTHQQELLIEIEAKALKAVAKWRRLALIKPSRKESEIIAEEHY